MENRHPNPTPPLAAPLVVLLLTALCLGGCSVRKMAINSLASSLTGSSEVFTSDDDPKLIGEALPFALKTFETLLAEVPENRNLLIATCSSYLQYGYAYVEMEAIRLEPTDYRAAQAERERALKHYMRARRYCLSALDQRVPGTSERLRREPENALGAFDKTDDVALLYWSGLAWGATIAAGLDRPELVADVPAVRTLIERALALDPGFLNGAVHEAMVGVEGLPREMGGDLERAREHFDRAVELSNGKRPSPYVLWASLISVRAQDREEFTAMLEKALAIDPEARPKERLATLISQQRARLLLEQIDLLFI